MSKRFRAEQKAWREANADAIARVTSEGPVDVLDEIPCTAVSRNGIEYRIHGLIHGQRRLLRNSPRVMDWLRAQISAMDRAPDETFVTERGFARLLGLGKSRELDYGTDFLRRIAKWQLAAVTVAFAISPVWLPFAVVALRLSRDPMTKAMRTAMRDERYLPRVRKLQRLSSLPAERAFAIDPRAFKRVHSEAMADALVAHAEARDVKIVHVICGLAHEADLVYLLSR